MKTKNAFAFRDFDSERILQRPFFKNFLFVPNQSDAQIMESLNMVAEDSIDAWERNLYVIKAIHDQLSELRRLINKHYKKRLERYNKKKSKPKNISVPELHRSAPVVEYFDASLKVLELMNKFRALYREIEKKLQIRYRKEFASRLKQARQAMGMTQKQLGDLIQVSPQGFSLYERGERDVSVSTIIRLAKILNMSGDQILGLT